VKSCKATEGPPAQRISAQAQFARGQRCRADLPGVQDFTGVPCVVDLAAMRDAMKNLAATRTRINPLQPVELVIDHSVKVANSAPTLFQLNAELEFLRNKNAMHSSAGAKPLSEIWPSFLRHRHRPPGKPRISRPRGFRK